MDYASIEGISPPISRVVLGTDWFNARRFFWLAGRQFSSPVVDRPRRRVLFELLDGVVEAGCTAFDTARTYRDSEEVLGAWLHTRQMRERVAIITKGAHPGPGWASRLSPAEIERDLHRSLKALRTDYIDLYLLHYDDGVTEAGPLVDALNRHYEGGRIRAYGVSNWPTQRIARAISHAVQHGSKPPVLSSVQFSLASWRHPPWKDALSLSGEENELDRRWYKESGLWLLAYSSLAMGFFSRSRDQTGSAAPAMPERPDHNVFGQAANDARRERVREIARDRGVSPGQVALAWVLGFDRRVLAVVGTRNVESFADAARACGLTLSESEREWLYSGRRTE